MKRFLLTLSVFVLLVPWSLAAIAVVLGAIQGDLSTLAVLWPMAVFVGGAGYVHRRRTKLDQHVSAAIGATAILASPLLLAPLVVAGMFTAQPASITEPGVPSPPEFEPAVATQTERPMPDYDVVISSDVAAADFPEVGWLGVQIETVEESDPRSVGAAKEGGVEVVQVQEARPAERAGIRARDIIVSIDGERMLTSFDVTLKIQQTEPGTRVTITVVRDDLVHELTPTLTSKYGPDGCPPWPCYY